MKINFLLKIFHLKAIERYILRQAFEALNILKFSVLLVFQSILLNKFYRFKENVDSNFTQLNYNVIIKMEPFV